jgi:hypothetical protein
MARKLRGQEDCIGCPFRVMLEVGPQFFSRDPIISTCGNGYRVLGYSQQHMEVDSEDCPDRVGIQVSRIGSTRFERVTLEDGL